MLIAMSEALRYDVQLFNDYKLKWNMAYPVYVINGCQWLFEADELRKRPATICRNMPCNQNIQQNLEKSDQLSQHLVTLLHIHLESNNVPFPMSLTIVWTQCSRNRSNV